MKKLKNNRINPKEIIGQETATNAKGSPAQKNTFSATPDRSSKSAEVPSPVRREVLRTDRSDLDTYLGGDSGSASSVGLSDIRKYVESMHIDIQVLRRDGSGLMTEQEVRDMFAAFVEHFNAQPLHQIRSHRCLHGDPATTPSAGLSDIRKRVESMHIDIQVLRRDGSGQMTQQELRQMFASFVERFSAPPLHQIRRRRQYPAARLITFDTDFALRLRAPESASPAMRKWLATLQANIRAAEARKVDKRPA